MSSPKFLFEGEIDKLMNEIVESIDIPKTESEEKEFANVDDSLVSGLV